MYDQDKEIQDKKNRIKKILTYILATFTLALLMWMVYVLVWTFLEGDREEVKPEVVDEEVVFDPSLIPTYQNLQISMDGMMVDVYGESLTTSIQGGKLKVPNTNIEFKTNYLADSVDVMALTVAAMQMNPYAITDKHPKVFSVLIETKETSVRTLPNGEEIDLANLEQSYTDVEFYGDRVNPAELEVRGLVNGEPFNQLVNLNPYFQLYQN